MPKNYGLAGRMIRFVKKQQQRKADLESTTRSHRRVPTIGRSFIPIDKLDTSGLLSAEVEYLTCMYFSHRFDLLGSGWLETGYDSVSPGLEGHCYDMNLRIARFDPDGKWLDRLLPRPHALQSREIWKVLTETCSLAEKSEQITYVPIDWQKDYKSGFRYNASAWYRDQRKKNFPGADIKLPRELCRMQHLVRLAIFALFVKRNTFHGKDQGQAATFSVEKHIAEFRHQVLDFIAANPPRLGCNWSCTMDVAIRATNLLVAYDLFCQLDQSGLLDEGFKRIFTVSIYEHGKHILNNLEWHGGRTTNHYMANICGLLFIAAYFERSPETDTWLVFAVQEIIAEFARQFNRDGSNFEASTSYHRLSGEMVLYSTALILGLPDDKIMALDACYGNRLTALTRPGNKHKARLKMTAGNASELFSTDYREVLYRAGLFSCHLTKPNNRVPQIGDNDSGHFFHISPCGKFLPNHEAEAKYLNLKGYSRITQAFGDRLFWDEDVLSHNPFISALNGLFQDGPFEKSSNAFPLEYSLVCALAGGRSFKSPEVKNRRVPMTDQRSVRTGLKSNKITIRPLEKKAVSLTQNLKVYPYPDAGVFIFSSDRIHLTVYAAVNGQNDRGGHSHNDKLSFELNIDGEDILLDPGTYLYTPLPERRNQFRSVEMHNTIIIPGQEQNRWRPGLKGLFKISNEVNCQILALGDARICLQARYRNIILERNIQLKDQEIVVQDFANRPFESNINGARYYSNGYGKILRGIGIDLKKIRSDL